GRDERDGAPAAARRAAPERGDGDEEGRESPGHERDTGARGGRVPLAPAELDSGGDEHSADELALPVRVRPDVAGVPVREPELQRLVLGREGRIRAERVAEGESLAPEAAARLGEMEVERPRVELQRRLREVVRDLRAVRLIHVADP